MNKLSIILLKSLRKIYLNIFSTNKNIRLEYEENPDKVSQIIYETLTDDKPCMIARFGANELLCLVTYLSVKANNKNIFKYISGQTDEWWWNSKNLENMRYVAGFYPPTKAKFEEFGTLMLNEIPEVDVLASWQNDELQFKEELKHAKKIRMMYLDPFWTQNPWTKALEGKNILVVHPFKTTIEEQYKKRASLFENKDILPEFKSLNVIKSIQSLEHPEDRFHDWFEALEYMKFEINKYDFDICLIGCGAYGFPLAAHVKRMGKKVVHMGGSLQLLFGIRGKRWEQYDPHYEQPGNIFIHYYGLPNEHWVRPSEEEKPVNHSKVEDSAYW